MSERTGFLGDERWERWAGIGGLAFVVLTLAWGVLYAPAPGSGDSDQKIADWYGDHGNRTKVWVAAILLMLAAVAFLWFLGSLRTLLRRVEGPPGRVSALSFGAGLVLTALVFAKNAAATAPAVSITFGLDSSELDPAAFRLFNALFHLLVYQELFAGAALIAFTSVLALRTGLLPRWLGGGGFVVAAVVAALFWQEAVPLALVLAWILVLSVLVLRTASPVRSAPET
jgi:hypothetical protein